MLKNTILILANEITLKNLLEMQISSEYTHKIVFEKDFKSMMRRFEDIDEIACVLASHKHHPSEVKRLIEFTNKNARAIPVILISDNIPKNSSLFDSFLTTNNDNCFLALPIDEEELLGQLRKAIKVEFKSIKENHRRVSIDKVPYFVNANISIFGLHRTNGYIELELTNDSQLKEDQYYFVLLDDYKNFFKNITEAIKKQLYSKKGTIQSKVTTQLNAVSRVHQTLTDIGLSEQSIEIAQANIKTSIEMLRKCPKTSLLLGKMIKYDNYIYELALMTGYLSSAILRYTDWSSKYSMEKLTTAALLQDISIQDEKLAKIVSKDSLEFIELSESEKEIVLNHPSTTLEYLDEVEGITDIASNIQSLIQNHHERPGGRGFPRAIDGKMLSPLSCVFNLANEFSHRLLYKKLSITTLEQIIIDFERDFNKGHYKKAYMAFKKVFKRTN